MSKIFLTIAIIWITTNVNAQIHSLGIQGGLNITNISAKEVFDDTENEVGFIGGLKYEVLLSEKYLLGIDMLYAQQGFVDKIMFTDQIGNPIGDLALKFKYNYFSLPLKFGYSFGDNFKIIPKIGIQPSLFLNAKTIVPKFNNNGDVIGEETLNANDNVSQFDLAGLLEIELGYSINQTIDVFTSVSGKYSMTTFSYEDYEQYKFRHKSLSLLIGLKYKINKE